MTMELQRAACRGALMAPTGEMKNVDEKEVRDSDWIAQRERFVDILSRDENFGSWPKAMSLLDESALSRKIGLSLATLRDWRPSGPPFFELPGHLIRYRPREVAHWLEERLGLKQHEKHAKRNRSEEDRFERISTCFHAAAREIKASRSAMGLKLQNFSPSRRRFWKSGASVKSGRISSRCLGCRSLIRVSPSRRGWT